MGSDPSSTMGFERRFNRALKIDAVDDFIADALGKNAPRPPNMDRIVELNRGPFLGAPAPLERLESADDAIVLDVRHRKSSRPDTCRTRSTSASTARRSRRAPRSCCRRRASSSATDEQQAERAARGLRAVGILDLGGYVVDPAGATEQLEPIDLEELEQLLGSDEVELVDVREKEERDDGYIVGSTHIPYRLVGPLADGLSTDKPVVTI